MLLASGLEIIGQSYELRLRAHCSELACASVHHW